MKWILVWNTTAPKGNYYTLIVTLIATLFITIGIRGYMKTR
ncbi:unnamed protein product, partial [marine sediment metagenome]